jgi:hypothetical protein
MNIRSLLLAAFVLGWAATMGSASPITYDFSGTLSQPVNGSTAFSGTFSYDETSSGVSNGLLVTGYTTAHATLSAGGQSYEFKNYLSTPWPPTSYEFDANSKGQGDNFTFLGRYGVNTSSSDPNAPTAAMTIHLGDPTGTAFPPTYLNLPEFILSKYSIRDFSVTLPSIGTPVAGTLTSLALDLGHQTQTQTQSQSQTQSQTQSQAQSQTQPSASNSALDQPQAAPEPTTLALFAMIGLGLAARWKIRRTV